MISSKGKSIFLKAVALCLLIQQSAALTTEAPSDGGFFDDNNNKAMFLVLPGMILVYGGCCLIYCVHKCRRYCAKKKKQKIKAEKRREKEKERNAFSNTVVTITDEKPSTSKANFGSASHASTGTTTLTLECLDNDDAMEKGRLMGDNNQETNVDEVEDILQKESVRAVSPGYHRESNYNTAGLDKEMENLDYQLKAAFRLAKTDGKKPITPQPDTSHGVTKASIELDSMKHKGSNLKNTDSFNETKRNVIETKDEHAGEKHKVDNIPKRKISVLDVKRKDVTFPNDIPMEDLKSIANVRNMVLKEMPKSMPDLIRRPDENTAVLKRIGGGGGKRKIFLSSQ